MFLPRDLILGTRMFNSADIDELMEADDSDVHGRTRRMPEPGSRRVVPDVRSGEDRDAA